ncbi:MAG: alanine/ornithine racemase family PLP-dependent enzyme [Candidatus Hodarchaeota archaeon]
MIFLPRVQIDLKKIRHNAKTLLNLLGSRGFSLMAVSKVVLGDPRIVRELVKAGILCIGDSRIENIIKMKNAGINAFFTLIRVPSFIEIPDVVRYADISLNTELETIKAISKEARKQGKTHGILLMVELGDRREGIMKQDLNEFVEQILELENINLKGIGTNLKCFRGVVPDEDNMSELSSLAHEIQDIHGISLDLISGGNSANYNWMVSTKNRYLINNLRIGEALFLGKETINYEPIPELYTDIFKLFAEIVEIKKKPVSPRGKITSNGFGEPVKAPNRFYNLGEVNKKRLQALVNVGRQDVLVDGLDPILNIEILGGSSDYLIVNLKNHHPKLGDSLEFHLNYGALLYAMTSPFIDKVYIP